MSSIGIRFPDYSEIVDRAGRLPRKVAERELKVQVLPLCYRMQPNSSELAGRERNERPENHRVTSCACVWVWAGTVS